MVGHRLSCAVERQLQEVCTKTLGNEKRRAFQERHISNKTPLFLQPGEAREGGREGGREREREILVHIKINQPTNQQTNK